MSSQRRFVAIARAFQERMAMIEGGPAKFLGDNRSLGGFPGGFVLGNLLPRLQDPDPSLALGVKPRSFWSEHRQGFKAFA